MQIKTKLKSILDRDGFLRVRNVLNFNKDLKPILNDMEYVMDNLVHKFAPENMKEKIFKSNLKFKKEVKKVTELKNKLLINFEDNTNDLVDYMFVCDGVFSNTKSLIENKNLSPTYSGAVAIRTILNSKNHKELDAKNVTPEDLGGYMTGLKK